MLASFTIKRTFYKTEIVLMVDNENKSALAYAKYDKIISNKTLPVYYYEVYTVEKAQDWVSRHLEGVDFTLKQLANNKG